MDLSIVIKIFRDCFRWDRIHYPRADVLTVAHDNDRSLLHAERWYSPLVDTLEDDLRSRGLRCISVTRIISRIKGDLSYGNALSPEGAFARALVVKRVFGLLFRRRYSYSRMEERIWARILDETGVSSVVGIQPSRELCVACHKRGIWVADIQHGVISESHPWYGEAFRGKDPVKYLPDAFLVWDQGSKQVLDKWAIGKGIQTIVTGNRWVARFMMPRSDDVLVNDLLQQYASENINKTQKKAILVALSWGEVNIPNGFMVDELRDVIHETSSQYHWFVRLHPNQLNGFATHEGRKFSKFFEENLSNFVEWEVATKSPLPIILSQVDLVISWNSSVSIEASQFGLNTCLLDPRLRPGGTRQDYYEFYKRRGFIHLIEPTKVQIRKAIDQYLKKEAREEDFDTHNVEYERLLVSLAVKKDFI